MARVSFEESDYVTPDSVQQKLALAEDPFIGELYHHITEDYRSWGHQSRYNNFKSYFELIRHREIHRMYTRSPLNEFVQSIEMPGERESWTVLPIADKHGNSFTAYPPGVIPPQFDLFDSPDGIELSPYDEKIQTDGLDERLALDVHTFDQFAQQADLDSMDAYMKRVREVHGPYQRGEAIVPDLVTRIPKPIRRNEGNPLSLYSALDQVAVDTLFTPDRPIGDLTLVERAKAKVVEAHRSATWTTRAADQAATWGEQAALRQLYERSLYAHHVASLVSLEQGKQMPSPPLPDPRLSRASLTDARKRFSVRLVTLNELNYPIHDTSDPLARQKYQASIGAYVVAGQESGFLPADIDKLPKIFRDALEALRRADFIVERDKALALAKKGHEQMMLMRQEILGNLDSPQFVNVHWSGPDSRYEHIPSNDRWQKLPAQNQQTSAAALASSATPPALPSTTSPSTTAATTSTANAPSTVANESVVNKYFSPSLNEFDWPAFNKDVFSTDMTPAEFDVACEAMLQALDLQHQAALPALSLEAQRSILPQDSISLTPTERLAQRHQKIQFGISEFAAANPRPTMPKKITRESYELYENRMDLWLKERERTHRRLVKENPISLPPMKDALAAMGLVAQDPVTGEERVATWAEILVQKADSDAADFYRNFFEFLQRDTTGELSLDEVNAFAAQHQSKLGLLGLSGPNDAARASFVDTFRPFASLSEQAIIDAYGENSLNFGLGASMDKRHRYLRAQRLTEDIERKLALSPTSKLPHSLSLQKTTKELEQARRAAINDHTQVIHEGLLMKSAEEFEKSKTRLNDALRTARSDFDLRLQYRNYAIITTDPELKYMSAPQISGPPEHIPLHRSLHWPFRILTWLQRYLLHKPAYHALLTYNWFATRWSFERSWVARWLVRRSGMDLAYSAADTVGLDPKTAHFYHPYYRHTLYRLYYFLHAPETAKMSLPERALATSPSLPTWSEFRLNNWRLRWMERLSSLVSKPSRLIVLPAIAMATAATVAMLEQRNTWAHDVIRAQPAGLEVSSEERRRWLQRSIPIWSKRGPKPIFLGIGHTPLEYQDAPYLHTANSSNAADFRIIGN